MISPHRKTVRSWKWERTAEMTNAHNMDDTDDDDDDAIATDDDCYYDYVANDFDTDAMMMTMMTILMTMFVMFDTDDAHDY